MSASEFAFLALGLVLGVATGAALIEVLRAHPPAPRLVRVTVGPDSVPRRVPATLARDPFAPPPPKPALDEHDYDPIGIRRPPEARTIVPSSPRASAPSAQFPPRYVVVRPAGTSGAPSANFAAGRMIGIPILPEPDEFLAQFAGATRRGSRPPAAGGGVALLERLDIALSAAARDERSPAGTRAAAPAIDPTPAMRG